MRMAKLFALLLFALAGPCVGQVIVSMNGAPSATPVGVFGSAAAPTAGTAVVASASLTGSFRVVANCMFTVGSPVALDVTNMQFAVGGTGIGGRLLVPGTILTAVGSIYVLDRVTLAAQTVSVIATASATAGVTYACTLYTWSVA